MKAITKWRMAAIAILLSFTSNAQLGESCGCPDLASRTTVNVSTLTDVDGNLTSSQTFTCDNTYFLDVTLWIPAGVTLTVEPGTVFRGTDAVSVPDGMGGTTSVATAVIVTRDGKMIANGTKDCQIIFTSENDPLDGTYPIANTAEWGGVIVLGRASNNLEAVSGAARGLGEIEGTISPDPRTYYGADLDGTLGAPESFDDNDDSGVYRWISIRHGGFDLAVDAEINGFTCGSVGRGTTVEHIEVVSNSDDGVEFFGGTVDVKYVSVLFCEDDYIDWDQGYQGRIQFMFGVQSDGQNSDGKTIGDHGFELDGNDDAVGTPFTDAQLYNATVLCNTADEAIESKEFTAGRVANSIFAQGTESIRMRDGASHGVSGTGGTFLTGNYEVLNNVFIAPTSGTFLDLDNTDVGEAALFASSGNTTLASGVVDYDFTFDVTTNAVSDPFNPVPAAGDPEVVTDVMPPLDDFFCQVAYRGAFEPGCDPWTKGGYLSTLGVDASSDDCPTDLNNNGVTDVNDFLEVLGQFGVSCN